MMRQFYDRSFNGINEANNYGCSFFGANHAPMFIIGFLILAVTVLVIVMIYKHHKISQANTPGATPPNPSTNDNALDILNERLAKGEITPEEYTKIKELLK